MPQSFFRGLALNRSVLGVNVSGNRCTGFWGPLQWQEWDEAGLQAVCQALSVNSTLQYLDLSTNR